LPQDFSHEKGRPHPLAKTQQHSTRFFLQEHLVTAPVFHGGVGNKDIETVLLREGWQPVHLGDQQDMGARAKVRRLRKGVATLTSLPKGATLLLQWPLYARLHRVLLGALLRFRPDVHVICFLTDINGLKDGNATLLQQELAIFRRMTNFIVHNEVMESWLKNQVPGARAAQIGFFDFLAPAANGARSLSNEVCFAGNLAKSPFLQQLAEYSPLRFHLYGDRAAWVSEAFNCTYHGQFSPTALPPMVEGSFGLVWDGESATRLNGVLGDYARWISPHKLSLYILAGMPVICHRDSAAAGLATQYGIGFSVNSIGEIPERINTILEEDYQQMRRNMRPLAERISKGECLLDALRQLSAC
jgi:hypothetical protein